MYVESCETGLFLTQSGNQVQSELVSRIKQLEMEVEAREKRLTEKEQTISHLRAGLRRTEHRVSANKQRALYAENEAVTLERQKEQLQSKIEQMRKGIDELNRTHAQRLDEAKDDMQKVIVEKENELREAYCKLEDKEKELREQRIEVERVSRRLEAADRDMEEKSNKIKELKREEAVLRAELNSLDDEKSGNAYREGFVQPSTANYHNRFRNGM